MVIIGIYTVRYSDSRGMHPTLAKYNNSLYLPYYLRQVFLYAYRFDAHIASTFYIFALAKRQYVGFRIESITDLETAKSDF